MSWLWSKPPDPVELTKKWKSDLQKEIRAINREIRAIEREENKVKRSAREAVKRNDMESTRIFAKELVRSKKAKERLLQARVQIHSVQMQLQQNLAMLKIGNCIQKSARVTQIMNNLIRVPELAQTMRQLTREMDKAGLLEEMMEDTFDTLDEDVAEEDVSEEVDRVISELTKERLVKAPPVSKAELPVEEVPAAEEKPKPSVEDDLLRLRVGSLHES